MKIPSCMSRVKTGRAEKCVNMESPETAWEKLMEGNRRFAAGEPMHPRRAPGVRAELTAGQQPFAAIVGCSDSRAPAEIIFDCGLGDLFVVRTAGQVLTEAGYASLEFAAEFLGVRLIVVLGHTDCGAVKSALQGVKSSGYLGELLALLQPVAASVPPDHPDALNRAVEENVRRSVQRLRTLDPVLEKLVGEGRVTIIGAVYDLATGHVSEVRDDGGKRSTGGAL